MNNGEKITPPEREAVEERSYRERVYEIVRRIPHGRVMTYGQIAEMLGEGYTPRTVGYVMHAANENDPWHRVINAQGGCSTGRIVLPPDKQQRMLEAEPVAGALANLDIGEQAENRAAPIRAAPRARDIEPAVACLRQRLAACRARDRPTPPPC